MLFNLTGEDNKCRAINALIRHDESRDDVLVRFVKLAGQALGIPGSFISVLDDENQYIKAAHNFPLRKGPREDAFCRFVFESGRELIIPDTYNDPLFFKHPLTLGYPYIRFYAGVPLKNRDGVTLGTLCVTDTVAHPFSDEKIKTLRLLAGLVISFLEAWHSAGFVDPATDLPNRERLLRDLQLLAPGGQKSEYRLVLIDCMEMSRAYELAKSLGMAAVEALLRDMAILLRLRLRLAPSQMLYTVATGRFAILIPASGAYTASEISRKLQGVCAHVEETISIELAVYTGEVTFDPAAQPAHEILRRGISALNEGINLKIPACTFDDVINSRKYAAVSLVDDLASALEQDAGLYLVYQPKVSMSSGKPVGLEALIRWHHPAYGELPPSLFLPLIDNTELMAKLTDWVIHGVIKQLATWQATALLLPVSINIRIADFSQDGFADRLEEKMFQAGLPTALLGIECLETDRIVENRAALQGLEMLKLRGFVIALDDFGAGYSNISYLRRMPLDVIKLDQSLIRELSGNTATRIIARSVIQMLKNLDYIVIAEGVEDADTSHLLQSYGCDQAQGYYYSKALEPKALESWLYWQLRDSLR
ncbi:EAL domain-containing protein [Erwinia tasmaniensis]|uniref:EAL domain-containing protein n=1 Tax=Erwinia tasmaniensis TaxID=338565 RepID=UPI003A4D378B